MYLVYHGCKFMKRRARKPAARVPIESKLFIDMFSLDLQMAMAKSFGDVFYYMKRDLPTAEKSDVQATSAKRSAGSSIDQPNQKSSRPVSHGKNRKQEMTARLEAALADKIKNHTPAKELQKWVDEQFATGGETRAAMGSIMGRTCRHCLFSGRGVMHHSRIECEKAGNLPCDPCPICAQAGYPSEYHWRSQCRRA